MKTVLRLIGMSITGALALFNLLGVIVGITDDGIQSYVWLYLSFLLVFSSVFASLLISQLKSNPKKSKTNQKAIRVTASSKEDVPIANVNAKEQFRELLDSLPKSIVEKNGKFHKRNYATADLKEFKFKTLSEISSLFDIDTFIAFDVETTGISLTGNEVIEISCVKFEKCVPTELLTSLIKPRRPIPAESTEIHHITDQMVENAPMFYEIIPALNNFLKNYPLVAHNASFDVMHTYAAGLDSMADKTVFDTCEISRKLCPNLDDHTLQTVCKNFGIFFDNAHRSSEDALACGQLFVKLLMEKFK